MNKNRFSFPQCSRRDLLRAGVYGVGVSAAAQPMPLFGQAAAALTVSSGASVGDLPPQRRWYLGGTQTIRGQKADTAESGNAYWFGRLELARPASGVRPMIFGDIGWVGDRAAYRDVGRPMSGVGVGVSMLDGLIRTDASRGIYPQRRVRLDVYLDAKF